MQGMEEMNMATIKINDLNEDRVVTEDELRHVQGGILIGLLLPAVQKVRVTEPSIGAYKMGDGSV